MYQNMIEFINEIQKFVISHTDLILNQDIL